MLDGPPTPYYPSPFLINQFCSMHPAVVKSLQDPEGRGRIQLLCPGVKGKGGKNWTCWVEACVMPIGSGIGTGDEGDWWPFQVGQGGLLGFVTGYPDAHFFIPGPPPADGAEQLMPAEPKSYNDGRKITRCRIRKSEAGHTLLMDDNGKSELLGFMSWTGAGFVAHEPGKEEDEKESPDEESKPRKGKRRETKNVWSGTAGKPSELIEGGKGYYSFCDLQGNGMFTFACDAEGGSMAFIAKKKDGSVGASFILDGEEELAIVTAGKTQVQVRGKQKAVYTTKKMIWDIPFMKVSPYWEAIKKKIGDRLKKYDE